MKRTMSRLFTAVLMAALLVGASIMSVSAATVTATQPCDGLHTDWTPIPVEGDTISENGNYYLTGTTGRIVVDSGVKATLCLNGETVTQNTKYGSIAVSGELTLCNCSTTAGKVGTGVDGAKSTYVPLWIGGTVTMYDNVTIDGSGRSAGPCVQVQGGQAPRLVVIAAASG